MTLQAQFPYYQIPKPAGSFSIKLFMPVCPFHRIVFSLIEITLAKDALYGVSAKQIHNDAYLSRRIAYRKCIAVNVVDKKRWPNGAQVVLIHESTKSCSKQK